MKRVFSVIDLETTGTKADDGARIIQWSIVQISKGKIIKQESSFINPNQSIPQYIEKLTGITDEHVEHAPSFEDCYETIQALLQDTIVVGHSVEFDLYFLNHEIKLINKPAITNKFIDTVELSRILFPTMESYRLQDLAKSFQIPLVNHHQADADAYATAELFLLLLEKWSKVPNGTKIRLHPLMKKMKSHYKLLFNDRAQLEFATDEDWDYFENGFTTLPTVNSEKMNSNGYRSFEMLLRKFEDKEEMNRIFPGFEIREAQLDFTKSAYSHFKEQKPLIYQGQTGIGKTLAYLLAAYGIYAEDRKPLLLSTSTKLLQGQIIEKDIPLLESIVGESISCVTLKGKGNYICPNKFMSLLSVSEERGDFRLARAQILVWLSETETGDIDELNLTTSGYLLWESINCADTNLINCSNCECFYRNNLEQAKHAFVVIVNHSTFIAHLRTNEHNYFDGRNYIFDEAHQLEKALYSSCIHKLDAQRMTYSLSQLVSLGLLQDFHRLSSKYGIFDFNLQVISEVLQEIRVLLQNLLKDFHSLSLKKAQEDLKGAETTISFEQGVKPSISKEISISQVKNIEAFIDKLNKQVEGIYSNTSLSLGDRDKHIITEFQLHISCILKNLHFIREMISTKDHLQWITSSEEIAPIHTQLHYIDFQEIEPLVDRVKGILKSSIFCSGTIRVKNEAQFFKEGLGLANLEIDVLSSNQVSNVPYGKIEVVTTEENSIDISLEVTKAISYAKNEGHKKIFVLFNSHASMNKVFEQWKNDVNYSTTLVQGYGNQGKNKMIKSFRQLDEGILFGTHMFFEGIDLPGDELTCMILTRLPFLPPSHPYVLIRSHLGGIEPPDRFYRIVLPYAVQLFQQAIGRLVRSHEDKGTFMILDPRYKKQSYGKSFRKVTESFKINEVSLDDLGNTSK